MKTTLDGPEPDTLDFAAFAPDPARAAALDRRARAALATSLARVFEACEGDLRWDRDAQASLLQALPSHPVAPTVFAVYADLVEAVFAEDLARAQRCLDMLLRPELSRRAAPRVVTVREADLGDGVPAIYRRFIADDPTLPMTLQPLSQDALDRVTRLVAQTTQLLHEAAPALAGEIAAVTHEMVMVDGGMPGSPASGTATFDGATTFYLWGALALNASRLSDRVALAESLAHEAGHAYLLGATLGAPLVENDPAERFVSPLRADARPMDGLVHASFVLARMVWCQDALSRSARLDEAETAAVTAASAANAERFAACEQLIAERALFTGLGATLWGSARAWMAAVRPEKAKTPGM